MATDVTKNGEFEFNDAVIVRTFVLQESLSHQRLTEEKINCLYHVFVGVNCFYVSHCVRHIPDLPSPVGLLQPSTINSRRNNVFSGFDLFPFTPCGLYRYLDTYRRYLRDDTSIAKVTIHRGIS